MKLTPNESNVLTKFLLQSIIQSSVVVQNQMLIISDSISSQFKKNITRYNLPDILIVLEHKNLVHIHVQVNMPLIQIIDWIFWNNT